MLLTILLLIGSNTFMTIAWYGHLKFTDKPMWQVILASWGIALFEYCLQVPANRFGYEAKIQPYQLKIIQEAITLSVFIVFAFFYFGQKPQWNHWAAFGLILIAVYLAVLPGKSA